MNKAIWKFELDIFKRDINRKLVISMPKDTIILTAGEQGESIYIWAEVDPNASTELRTFEVFGTGSDMYCDMGIGRKYIGTAILRNGRLVFHVYERIN